MAATFVVETGTVVANANAYITEAEADQYHDNNGTRTAWDAAADKEQSIRTATKFLEVTYKGKWLGVRVTTGQALSWPRSGVEDQDGYTIDSALIPQDLKDACAELALDAAPAGTDLTPDETAPIGTIKMRKNKVGPLEQVTEYVGGASSSSEPLRTVVVAKIRNLISDGDVLERG